MDIPNGNGVISSRSAAGDQADPRFIWLASGKACCWSPEEYVPAAILCFTSALSATLCLIVAAPKKQLAAGTNDFSVTSGHFMVVMMAKLFLKRHGRAIRRMRPRSRPAGIQPTPGKRTGRDGVRVRSRRAEGVSNLGPAGVDIPIQWLSLWQ